jgi:hypothetical protein
MTTALTLQIIKKSVNKKTNARSFFLTPPHREGIWCQEFGSRNAEWGKKEKVQGSSRRHAMAWLWFGRQGSGYIYVEPRTPER